MSPRTLQSEELCEVGADDKLDRIARVLNVLSKQRMKIIGKGPPDCLINQSLLLDVYLRQGLFSGRSTIK